MIYGFFILWIFKLECNKPNFIIFFFLLIFKKIRANEQREIVKKMKNGERNYYFL